jgi:biopolymer transport protein ExbB
MATSLTHGWCRLLACAGLAVCIAVMVVPAWGFQNEPIADPAFAADPNVAGDPAAAAPVETQRGPESFVEWMFRTSGLFGYLILLVAFVQVAIVFVQLIQLRRENFLPPGLIEQFERLLADKNYPSAYEAAKSSDSFLGRVLAAGLARVSRGYDEALRGMQAAGDAETLAHEQSISYLSLIGTVAPMLGLLGTVQGMLMSFRAMSASATAGPSFPLADGIAMALFTTLEGLAVALPAVVCCHLFKNRLASLVRECGVEAEELMTRFQNLPKIGAVAMSRPSATVAPTVPQERSAA